MIEFRFPRFPTHIEITKNKKAPNKWMKCNGQSLYNGAIARFGRSVAMRNLHSYFLRSLPRDIKLKEAKKIKYTIKTVINHGDISKRHNGICWKYPTENYIPRWDIENLASIFIKSGNDSLVMAGIIPDDSIQYVKSIEYEFQEVIDLEDREIIIQLYETTD